MARQLKPDELRAVCEAALLGFQSTEELAPLDGMIGQDRALNATTFGVRMRHAGYNLFVLGPPATGKTTLMRQLLAAAARTEPTPADLCYVHNFADPYRPTALTVPAGRGRELREAMARLVEECRAKLPRLFESEEFARRKSEILERFGHRQEAELDQLRQAARAEQFEVIRTPGGLALVPAPGGEPLGPEQFAALPPAVQAGFKARGDALDGRLDATLRELRRLEREARRAQEALVRESAAAATRQMIHEIREAFVALAAVQKYLDGVEEDIVAHAGEFTASESHPVLPFQPPPGAFLDRYEVNVLVERSHDAGAPVVFERNPTHGNLLGRLEHRAHFGTLVTDFTLIKAGALHRANGGYLLLEAKDVLTNFMAWTSLKKALKSHAIRLEEPLEELRLVSMASLAPEPIPLAVKVVLVGSPFLYYLLYNLDEDFRELFKVKVDFDDSLPRSHDAELAYARFVGRACREEGLRHFSADGIARLVEHGSRLVAHQGRLSTALGELLDVVRVAAFCAEQRQRPLVTGEDVARAIAEKIERSNLVEQRLGRMLSEGTLLIATAGQAVGQVNGISVMATGDYAFGRPSRITARTFAGEPGIVDIEREAKLGGPVHSKGVMILTGFLAGRYARDHPLALSASIAFEQHYEEIEGDSASSAELYALLSSLTGIPLTQALAVTGSVNQQGEIQAVGGINEKVEGFFDACRAGGLTGEQGVLIPEANVRHLMVREDIVAAVREGRFAVWAVSSVDQGLALLSGRAAGERGADGRFPDGSFNAAIERALAENVSRLRQFKASTSTT
jgi:predicted ATP-dependent protease